MNYIELEKIKQKALEDHIPIIMDDTLEVIEKYLKNEKPTRMLEIGTAVGYSAICFSEFLAENGEIDTIERETDRVKEAKENIKRAEVDKKINILESEEIIKNDLKGKRHFMKQLYAIIILIFLFAGYAKSQETHGTQQSVTTQDEVNSSINIDIAKIKLPPLSVLYENARSTPSIEILEKEKQLQKKLLAKEKRSWMSLFNAFGNVSHGIADNIGSSTDPTTPLIYRYTGTEQTSWSVGGSVTLPLETLFDLPGKIKRQRIQVDIAELRKQQAYEELKIQIAHLYVQILSNIETLQRSAEHLALYKGASAIAEQEYRNRRTTIDAVAQTKEKEFGANQGFASLRSTINDQLLMLEIISHTPILTIQEELSVTEGIDKSENTELK
mgnify:CR=1 FL=1